jgi:hypothetical protein
MMADKTSPGIFFLFRSIVEEKSRFQVHGNGVPGDPLPYAQITRLLPIKISQDTLGPRTVGMHEIDPAGIPAEVVGIDLAKGIREQTLVQLFGGLVHLLFLSGNSALGIE